MDIDSNPKFMDKGQSYFPESQIMDKKYGLDNHDKIYPHKRDRDKVKVREFANYGGNSDESGDFGQYKLEETEEIDDSNKSEIN